MCSLNLISKPYSRFPVCWSHFAKGEVNQNGLGKDTHVNILVLEPSNFEFAFSLLVKYIISDWSMYLLTTFRERITEA